MAIQAQFYSENIGFPLSHTQDLIMDNTCGLNQFCPKPEKQLQQQQNHMQYQQLPNLHRRNQGAYVDHNSALLQKNNTNCQQSVAFSQNLAAQIEKQRLEIDRYITLQNERLRWALQEQRKQQLALILKNNETKTQFLLRQKDEEIAKVTNRTIELEDSLKKVEIEKQAWQRLAKENEAMVLSLYNTIEQLRESACLSANGVEDAESCCDVIENRGRKRSVQKVGHQIKKQENAEQITRKMVCKGCNSRCSCIIIMPCRHLCLCKACETFLDSCPVCGMEKKATIEALI